MIFPHQFLKFSEQLAILETKLEEHRLLHEQNEMKMQEEIDEMNKELNDVKSTLKKKIEELGSSDSDEDDEMKNNDRAHSSLSNSFNENIDIEKV